MATGELIMAVDGNSLLHRSYHALAWTGARTSAGEPSWAIRGMVTQLVAAAERIGPTAIVVGFDDPELSHRRDRWPSYKAQRAEKLPTLVSQLALAGEILAGLGIHVVTPPGWEADDVLASAATGAAARGDRAVLVTSDRDAFCLIDDTTSVLRVISGGVEGSPLLTPDRLELMLGVRPEQYADFAALRGDPSDNLPGVDGIGPKRAATLLAEFGTAELMFADLESGGQRIRELLGPGVHARLAAPEARVRWQHNREVMCPVEVEVGLAADPLPGRLPLLPDEVHRAVLELGLPGTALAARRVLGRVSDPDPEPAVGAEPPGGLELDDLGWDPRAEWRSRRRMPPLPVDPQPTLF